MLPTSNSDQVCQEITRWLLWPPLPMPSEPISFEDAEVVDEDFWLLGGVWQNAGGNREVGRFPGSPRLFPVKNLHGPDQ